MAASLISEIVREAADLLRHDSLDTRLQDWVSMTANDMSQRVKGWRFYSYEAFAYDYSNPPIAPTGGLVSSVSNPILLQLTTATGAVQNHCPEYVSFNQYRAMVPPYVGSATTGVTAVTDVKIWTIGPAWWTQGTLGGASPTTAGKSYVMIYPKCMSLLNCVLFFEGLPYSDTANLVDYSSLPYHWEHVLVWGTAALGAKFLRPELYPLYLSEYEQGLKDMQLTLSYWPDSVPTMRGINGPYANSPRMMAPPRLPLGQ
jgi:hypothetical protein